MGAPTNTTTNTTTSAPTNPDVAATASILAKKLGGLADTSPAAYGQSLYPGVGPTTQQGWATALQAANNPDYATGIGNTVKSFSDIASGKMFGQNDPGYAALRQKTIDDTLTNIGEQFGNSGRLGGGSYLQAAGEGVGNAVAGLDYANYQNDVARQQQAAAALPGLFQAQQLPASIYGSVGAAQDADQAAQRQGAYDLYTRQQNAPIDWLSRLTSAAAGNAASTGTTTTNTQTTPGTPWWQTGLSLGLGAASLFL